MRRGPFILVSAILAACGGSTTSDPSSPTTPPGSSSSSSGGAATSCDAPAADVAVASDDLNGYPPYAVSGCSLAYVSTTGDLVLRDLATGAEETIAPASDHPRRPAASADLVAWESVVGGRSVVRVRMRSAGVETIIEGATFGAGEPRVSGTAVVFTAWVTADDTDVWLYDAKTRETRVVFEGAAQQRFADVSDAYVVATDFSEDPDGTYNGAGDLADIVVFDRATGTVTKRVAENEVEKRKQAFPMLVDGTRLAYLEWNLVHPEPKLEGYALRVGTITGSPLEDFTLADIRLFGSEPVRPSTSNGTIEWISNPNGTTTLYRATADRAQLPQAVSGLEGLHLYAPASSGAFTVVATVPTDRSGVTPQLRAVAR